MKFYWFLSLVFTTSECKTLPIVTNVFNDDLSRPSLHHSADGIHDLTVHYQAQNTFRKSKPPNIEVAKNEESIIMPFIEYLFWNVAVLDVSGVLNALRKHSAEELNSQPSTWLGDSLLTFLSRTHTCTTRTIPLVILLLRYGADPTIAQQGSGETALMHYATGDNVLLTSFLTSDTYRDKTINALDSVKRTALFHAIEGRAHSSTKILIHSNIPLNHKDNDGNTALHIAVAIQNREAVKLLLQANANSVVLNKFLADPIFEALSTGDRQMINTIVKSHSYKLGIDPTRAAGTARFTRITSAFEMRLPQKTILRLLAPEFASQDTTLCLLRDSQGRNVIAMAIDMQYPEVLDRLISYFESSSLKRLPLWQQCNVHEPSDDNVFPVEKFLRSYGSFRRNTRLLKKLFASVAPVDGASALMQAMRHKGEEFALNNFVPYGDPEISLRDLKLDAHETGAETWGHNAVTLASELPGTTGLSAAKRLLSLMAVGVIGQISEISEAFLQSLSTAAHLRDAALIQEIALQASSAIQQWYCRFSEIDASQVEEAKFLTQSLPRTFAGFTNRISCAPLVHHVNLVLNRVRQGHTPRLDVVEILSRPPYANFNIGRHVREALYLVGSTSVFDFQRPHPSLGSVMEELGLRIGWYRNALQIFNLKLDVQESKRLHMYEKTNVKIWPFLPLYRIIPRGQNKSHANIQT